QSIFLDRPSYTAANVVDLLHFRRRRHAAQAQLVGEIAALQVGAGAVDGEGGPEYIAAALRHDVYVHAARLILAAAAARLDRRLFDRELIDELPLVCCSDLPDERAEGHAIDGHSVVHGTVVVHDEVAGAGKLATRAAHVLVG